MGKSQRTKGAVFEREICDKFSFSLNIELEQRFKRNIGQARDGGNDIDVGRLIVECKRRATLGTIYSWVQQAIDAARGQCVYVEDADGNEQMVPKIPVVVARQDGDTTPLVILRFDDFITLAGDKIKATL